MAGTVLTQIYVIWKLSWYLSLAIFPFTVFMVWLWFGTGYTIAEKQLIIRYGPFCEKIFFDDIKKIHKPALPLSSAALSFDRLEIIYGKFNKAIHISPFEEEKFVTFLKERCPQAKFHIKG
jgi:hypothetical protein